MARNSSLGHYIVCDTVINWKQERVKSSSNVDLHRWLSQPVTPNLLFGPEIQNWCNWCTRDS